MNLIISSIIKYWKAALILVIAAFFLVTYLIIKSERDSALKTIAEMQLEATKQDERVKVLTEQGKRETASLQASHVAAIQHIRALYGTEITNDKKAISNYRIALAEQLRKQSEGGASIVSNNDANQPARDNSDTAIARQPEDSDTDYRVMYLGASEYIKTLKQAGAVCAADYNLCKAYVDQEQKRIGVYVE